MANEIEVLIVDDSALMRNLIGHMVDETPGLIVADKAINGLFALQKIPRVNPDVIVLDLEMPQMNGIEFLKERKKQNIDIPVVILSSIAEKGAAITMEALSLGASDFIQKPGGSISTDLNSVRDSLVEKLLSYGSLYRLSHNKKVLSGEEYKAEKAAAQKEEKAEIAAGTRSKSIDISALLHGFSATPASPATHPQQIRKPGPTQIIAIGISTGGPDALRVVFSKLDADLKVPIVVVQHMPQGFTAEFAMSLDRICPLKVTEAQEGDKILPGHILIAQGNKHLEVEKKLGLGDAIGIAHLSDAPLVSGHRPSANVLFASVAMQFKNNALGVIMTGMGNDGAQQLGTIYKEGGMTLGQDEKSAIVYGMPKVAWEMGHVMEQVSLDNMARRICDVAKTMR
ncbi:MAG: chemotaxis response regulator protein-glutamate methylesterase [Spirochaetaceae bacterium]|jgi:two-component system chemotaxis response regulator CheB|nr:chemotaxis response regulator protein-glutamate methylesterase [Spirochaetaceae bacterium]